MDKDLYEALQEANRRAQGGLCVLSPKSHNDEDRKVFDRLVLALHELRDNGFVKFRDKGQLMTDNMNNNYQYLGIACEITYKGEKALSYGSHDAYRKSLPTYQTPTVNVVDQSFKNYGNMNGSNIASHSNQSHFTMGENLEFERVFNQIVEALRKDATLTQSKMQELIDDVQTLKREIQRENPRTRIITELYSFLGNTASIASILPKIVEFLPS